MKSNVSEEEALSHAFTLLIPKLLPQITIEYIKNTIRVIYSAKRLLLN